MIRSFFGNMTMPHVNLMNFTLVLVLLRLIVVVVVTFISAPVVNLVEQQEHPTIQRAIQVVLN